MAFLAIPEIIEGAEFTMAELLPTIRNAIQRIPEIKQSINCSAHYILAYSGLCLFFIGQCPASVP